MPGSWEKSCFSGGPDACETTSLPIGSMEDVWPVLGRFLLQLSLLLTKNKADRCQLIIQSLYEWFFNLMSLFFRSESTIAAQMRSFVF